MAKHGDPVLGMSGFHFRGGGGGSIEPPKTGGGGVREKGSIDGHHLSVIMKSGPVPNPSVPKQRPTSPPRVGPSKPYPQGVVECPIIRPNSLLSPPQRHIKRS